MDDFSGRNALLKTSGLKTGRILDIGMGCCCCMSFFLAKRGFNVIGIDPSRYVLYTVRRKAKKNKFKGTFEARLADAEKLPFEDNEFDAVIAYHSIHHMDNVKKAIKEMFRVCKIDGLVLISELHEEGQKAYEHKSDKGRLLKRTEKLLTQYAQSIQKTNTKYNTIIICKKETHIYEYRKEKTITIR
jgi:ubiquinone/menaquinone biosynthesis C-methylase UbiE